jgi:uncharacterized protein
VFKIKILFFSDLHGDMKALSNLKAKAKDTDLVVCAGDFTVMERNVDDVMKNISGIGKHVLMLHGNHEDEDNIKELCNNYDNLTFLHKGVYHVGDYVFLGYGGDGFSTNDPDFVKVSGFFRKETQGKKRIIFVTHGPAYDTKIDMLGRMPKGNKSYRNFIDDVQPHLAVSGHLHENAGKHHKIGRTLLLNPGKEGAIVDI